MSLGLPADFEPLGLDTPVADLCALQRLVRSVARHGQASVVEVGSWVGRTALALRATPGVHVKVYCVDTFAGTPDPDPTGRWAAEAGGKEKVYDTFRHNVRAYLHESIFPIRESSQAAAAGWVQGAEDLIFIDAEHTYL